MAERDPDDPQSAARARQQEMADHVEHILESVDPHLEEQSYPTNPNQLAADYRGTEFDLPNDTETLADAFDRLSDEYEEFETADQAREALTEELHRDEAFDEDWTNEPETE